MLNFEEKQEIVNTLANLLSVSLGPGAKADQVHEEAKSLLMKIADLYFKDLRNRLRTKDQTPF